MGQKRLNTTQIFTLVSVLCSIFLAALDQTIVATAAPKIASDLHEFEAISWIFSAYMLASTVMVPIYGKLSDTYGRRIFYLGGIFVFLLGSVLCGTALFMAWIIVGRIIQGLGAGAIMVESFTIIGDIFPPAERGKWQGLISSVFGLASIIGPVLGGLLTDYASWRWVFFINIPIGLLAMGLVRRHFPKVSNKGSLEKINFMNAFLLTLTLLAFLCALMRSEAQAQWLSGDVIFLLTASLILLVIFVIRDQRAVYPIFPAMLFHSKIFNISIIAVFLLAICMFGVVSYLPLFMQMSLMKSSSASGLILIPFVVALTLASALGGQIVSRTGKYKSLVVSGVAITCAALFMLSRITLSVSPAQLTFNLILVGAGMGVTLPIFIVIVQSSFGHDHLGLVTASMQLIRNLGATIGTAVLGTLIVISVETKLFAAGVHTGSGNLNLENFTETLKIIQNNVNDQQSLLALRHSFAEATNMVVLCCFFMSSIALALVSCLPVIRLRKSNSNAAEL